MFRNTLQNIDLNNNRLLQRITAVYENKSDKLITHLNGEKAQAMFMCYRVSTTPSTFPTLFTFLVTSTKVLISTIVSF